MKQLLSIYVFYRPFILWSLGVSFLFSIIGYNLIPIFIIKLVLIVFLWYLLANTNGSKKFIFYKNLGISNLKLFSSIFFIDICLNLPILLIFKEFV
jgi:hypothetical protein